MLAQAHGPVHYQHTIGPVPETARTVSGHFPFGLHEAVKGRAALYFILVREPVARVASLLRYIHMTPKHKLHDIVNAEGFSLAAYYKNKPDQAKIFSNGQTRQIAGGEVDLSKAMSNLWREDVVVGELDDLFGAMRRLGQRLPLNPYPELHRNVSNEFVLSEADVDAIKVHNTVDAALWTSVQAGWPGI